jgi:hypothetical protein
MATTAVAFKVGSIQFVLFTESLLFGFHVLFRPHQSEQQRNRSVKGARKKLFDLRNSDSSHDGRPADSNAGCRTHFTCTQDQLFAMRYAWALEWRMLPAQQYHARSVLTWIPGWVAKYPERLCLHFVVVTVLLIVHSLRLAHVKVEPRGMLACKISSVDQSPSSEADSCWASQKKNFPRILWNRPVGCRIHNIPPLHSQHPATSFTTSRHFIQNIPPLHSQHPATFLCSEPD